MKIVTYNTYQEKNGRDPAIDALLQSDAIVFLQEVKPRRALEIKRTLGSRAFVSPAKCGLLYLAIVLPEGWCFLKHKAAGLNGYKGGCIPAPWSLRCSYQRLTGRMPGWTDGLETRVVQIAYIADLRTDHAIRVLNTHLPFVPELRNRCLTTLGGLVGTGEVILAGDFNASRNSTLFRAFVLDMGLHFTGVLSRESTHNSGRKIDYIMYRGAFREVGYSVWRGDGLSDHRIVTVELERCV